jgi:hypothetical protein
VAFSRGNVVISYIGTSNGQSFYDVTSDFDSVEELEAVFFSSDGPKALRVWSQDNNANTVKEYIIRADMIVNIAIDRPDLF